MSTSLAGIRQIGLCNLGTLLTTPVDPIVLGIRAAAPFAITPFKPIKDYRNRSFRNMQNFKQAGESLQPTMRMISKLHAWLNGNADIQIITNKQNSNAGSEDVFQFVGDNLLWLEYLLAMDATKRSVNVTVEGALPHDDAQTLIDGSDSVTPVDLGAGVSEGGDLSKFRSPYMMALEYPQGTPMFAKGDLVSRKFEMKVKVKKSDETNTSGISFYQFKLEITGREASIAKIIADYGKSMSGNMLWKEKNTGAFYDAFDFAPGVVGVEDEVTIDDEQRIKKVTLNGDCPITDVSFLFGAAYGGDAGDTTGLKGGTMKIGY